MTQHQEEKNQCDGCKRGQPISRGLHATAINSSGVAYGWSVCTKDRYVAPEEKCYSCGGKGTYSQMTTEIGHEDFGGDGYRKPATIQNYPCKACNGTGNKPIPECGTDGKTMWCYCGKCKQESYPLPKDFPNPHQEMLKAHDELHKAGGCGCGFYKTKEGKDFVSPEEDREKHCMSCWNGDECTKSMCDCHAETASPDWEKAEREAWDTSFSSFRNSDEMADYLISRIKEAREEERGNIIRNSAGFIETAMIPKSAFDYVRRAALQSVREMLEGMKVPLKKRDEDLQFDGGNGIESYVISGKIATINAALSELDKK